MWYVLSYNQIRGLVSGAFDDYEMMFLGPVVEGENINWVPLVSMAMSWGTEEEAQNHVDMVWGSSFASTSFMIVKFNPKYGIDRDMEQYALDRLKERKDFGRRMAMRSIPKEELIAFAAINDDSPECGNRLTWRERWIIEMLTKKEG